MPLSKIVANSITDNTITTDQIADTSVHGRRNVIINGAMQVAQRGTSFTNKAAGAVYRLDRWEVSSFNVGDGEHNISQSTTAPDGFTFSTKIECAIQDTSQDANNQFYYQQQIEAQDINHLKFYESNPDSVTLSFHVRSNRTGTFPVALKLSDNNSADDNTATRIYQVTYSVSSADTWEKKSVTFTLDSSAQTKSTGNNFGMAVQFWLGAGSSRAGATANAWGDNGNATIAADNLDILGSTSNDWYITGVQLEVGDKATPFEHRSFGDELRRCQRYFEKNDYRIGSVSSHSQTNRGYRYNIRHLVEKRATPTCTITETAKNRCSTPTSPNVFTGSVVLRTTNNNTDGDDFTADGTYTIDAEL